MERRGADTAFGISKKGTTEKRDPGEVLCLISVTCVSVALILFTALLFHESDSEFAWIADWVIAGVGVLAGLSGLLVSALTRRRRTRPQRKVLLVLTGIAVLLPPLVGLLFITAVVNAL